jgi:hypothetical protein
MASSTTAPTLHEAVHDLNRAGDVTQPPKSPLTQRILTAQIDRDDAHAEPVAQILSDAVCGPFGVGGQADDGPRRWCHQQSFDHLGITPHPHSTNPCRSGWY